jgi:RsiW-degrading membrane proteinase PrsW (M82 family)
MLLFLTLGVCALGAAVIVYRYDLYDREPTLLLAAAVALGAAGMFVAGWLERITFDRLPGGTVPALALIASSLEETLKLVAVALLALAFRRAFNDPMDGMIYGSMAGLGAALEEGVAILRLLPAGRLFLPPEELVRLCGHLVMGGIGGFGIGYVIVRGMKGLPAVGVSLLAAVALHFGWDVISLREPAAGERPFLQALLGSALMLAGLLLYGRLVTVGSRWSQDVLAPGRPLRLGQWPPSRPPS